MVYVLVDRELSSACPYLKEVVTEASEVKEGERRFHVLEPTQFKIINDHLSTTLISLLESADPSIDIQDEPLTVNRSSSSLLAQLGITQLSPHLKFTLPRPHGSWTYTREPMNV